MRYGAMGEREDGIVELLLGNGRQGKYDMLRKRSQMRDGRYTC
jgi:hypothetical protein